MRAFYCIKLGELKFALLAAADRKEPSEVQRLNMKVPETFSSINITKFFSEPSLPPWRRGKSAASRSEGREVDPRAGTANFFLVNYNVFKGGFEG